MDTSADALGLSDRKLLRHGLPGVSPSVTCGRRCLGVSTDKTE